MMAKLKTVLQSAAVQVDISSGKVTKRLEGIGRMVHGLVGWKGVLVVLDSQRGNLITIDPDTEDQTTIWQVSQACLANSEAFLAEISVRSPRKLFILLSKEHLQDESVQKII